VFFVGIGIRNLHVQIISISGIERFLSAKHKHCADAILFIVSYLSVMWSGRSTTN